MADLVHDGVVDLPHQLGAVLARLEQRQPVDDDAVGQRPAVAAEAALLERDALVEPNSVSVSGSSPTSRMSSSDGSSSTTTATFSISSPMRPGSRSSARATTRSNSSRLIRSIAGYDTRGRTAGGCMDRLISLLGLVVFLGVAFVFSVNRKAVRWRTVCWT